MPSSDTASLYSRPKKRRLSSETLPPADSPIKSHKRKRLYVELPSPKSTWRATTTSNNVGSSNTSPRTSSQGSTLMETEDDSVTVVDVEEEPIPENEILTAEMNMILDLLNAWCMEHDIDVDHVLDWLDSPRNCAENSVSAEFWDQSRISLTGRLKLHLVTW
ncbi:hypothetical protein DL93DRAFT_1178698 [Clavulina sp. PMI_390]|nr:hypothetical protein DL93DRAFT_1178698 [Clavulina sp. PMI_390]